MILAFVNVQFLTERSELHGEPAIESTDFSIGGHVRRISLRLP